MRKLDLVLPLLALAGCAATPPALDIKNTALLSTAPVLDGITPRASEAEFHFHAADGNVVAIHREIIATDAPIPVSFPSDSRIDITPEQQGRRLCRRLSLRGRGLSHPGARLSDRQQPQSQQRDGLPDRLHRLVTGSVTSLGFVV